MSYKRARKIFHSNGIEYVRIHHDKKQIVMNQVITLYGRRIETEQRLAQAKVRTRWGGRRRRELRATVATNEIFCHINYL